MSSEPEPKKSLFSKLSYHTKLVLAAVIAVGSAMGVLAAMPGSLDTLEEYSPIVLKSEFRPIAGASCEARLRQQYELMQQTQISRDRAKARRDKIAERVHNQYLRDQQRAHNNLKRRCARYPKR